MLHPDSGLILVPIPKLATEFLVPSFSQLFSNLDLTDDVKIATFPRLLPRQTACTQRRPLFHLALPQVRILGRRLPLESYGTSDSPQPDTTCAASILSS